jgi:hypothetical protein
MPPQQYIRDKTGNALDLLGGMNLMLATNLIPQGQGFSFLQNVRRNLAGRAVSRPALGANILPGVLTGEQVTSLTRMNDATPYGPPSGYILIIGTLAGNLWVWDGGSSLGIVRYSLSGKPLSFVTFRPNASPQPWCYVADSTGFYKVRWDGSGIIGIPDQFKVGIVEPQIAPGVAVPIILNAPDPNWVMYRYVYRSSFTGAVSNPSPESSPQQVPQTTATGTITVPSPAPPTNGNFIFNAGQYEWNAGPATQFRTTGGVGAGVLTDYFVAIDFQSPPAGGTFPGTPLPTVPDNVIVEGIEVTLNWSGEDPATGILANVALYYQGQIIGQPKSPAIGNVTTAGGTLGYPTTVGTNIDLWGAPLTPAIVNDPSFGFGVQIETQQSGSTVRSFLFGFSVSVYYSSPNNGVVATESTDLQVDKIDFYRMDPGLENFTYVGTVANNPADPPGTQSAPLSDTLTDLDVANNPILQFDNYEPFPGIDLPRAGTVNVTGGVVNVVALTGTGSGMTPGVYPLVFSGGGGGSGATGIITVLDSVHSIMTVTNPGRGYTSTPTVTAVTGGIPPTMTAIMGTVVQYTSGDQFNPLWLPGTVVLIGPNPQTQVAYTLYNRPFADPASGGVVNTLIAVNITTDPTTGLIVNSYPPVGSGQLYNIQEPTLAGTAYPSPVIWGPTPDNAGSFYFGLDPLNPGDLLWSKGNNFDSAPDTNRMFVTSPSEPLMNGTITSELSTVFSTERFWLIYPNFGDLLAAVTGTEGQQWTLIQAQATRGLYMRYAIDALGSMIAYRAKDCIAVSQGGQAEESITDSIYNLFPHGGQTPANAQTTVVTPVTIAGQVVYPPDDTKPNAQTLKLSPGYIFYNYQDTNGVPRTLVYDIAAKGWSLDTYTPDANCHLWPVGPTTAPLLGCTDGTVRRLGDGGETGTSVIATRSESGADSRAPMRLGDMYLKALVNAGYNVQVALWKSRMTVQMSGYSPTALNPPSGLPPGTAVLASYILDFTAGFAADVDDVGVVFQWPLGSANVIDLWQPDWTELPEVTQDRPTDWDDGGSPGNKFVQGMYLECDTFGQTKTFQVESDDGTLHTPVECPFSQNGQAIRTFTFNPPFYAHMVRIISTDGVPWMIGPQAGWTMSLMAQTAPESSTSYTTESSSFGLYGYIHCYQINLAYIASAPVTVTLHTDQGDFALNFPPGGTSNAPAKILVKAPRNKWKICSFSVSSSAPVQIFKDLSEVWLKSWGSTGEYQKNCPFGGDSPPAATI